MDKVNVNGCPWIPVGRKACARLCELYVYDIEAVRFAGGRCGHRWREYCAGLHSAKGTDCGEFCEFKFKFNFFVKLNCGNCLYNFILYPRAAHRLNNTFRDCRKKSKMPPTRFGQMCAAPRRLCTQVGPIFSAQKSLCKF